jgi:hypothetical protein
MVVFFLNAGVQFFSEGLMQQQLDEFIGKDLSVLYNCVIKSCTLICCVCSLLDFSHAVFRVHRCERHTFHWKDITWNMVP